MGKITRGDSPSWTITVLDADGAALDLTGHTVSVTYKQAVTETDVEAAFKHFIIVDGSGDVVDSYGMELAGDVTAGVLTERLDPSDSDTLEVGKYWWDLEVRNGDDVITAIKPKTDDVIADVTRTAPV